MSNNRPAWEDGEDIVIQFSATTHPLRLTKDDASKLQRCLSDILDAKYPVTCMDCGERGMATHPWWYWTCAKCAKSYEGY